MVVEGEDRKIIFHVLEVQSLCLRLAATPIHNTETSRDNFILADPNTHISAVG
jgi:hypothetical protein